MRSGIPRLFSLDNEEEDEDSCNPPPRDLLTPGEPDTGDLLFTGGEA